MAGWHHWLYGHESEWTPGVGDGQGGLVCCDSWGRKESDTTEWLNWTELMSTCVFFFPLTISRSKDNHKEYFSGRMRSFQAFCWVCWLFTLYIWWYWSLNIMSLIMISENSKREEKCAEDIPLFPSRRNAASGSIWYCLWWSVLSQPLAKQAN